MQSKVWTLVLGLPIKNWLHKVALWIQEVSVLDISISGMSYSWQSVMKVFFLSLVCWIQHILWPCGVNGEVPQFTFNVPKAGFVLFRLPGLWALSGVISQVPDSLENDTWNSWYFFPQVFLALYTDPKYKELVVSLMFVSLILYLNRADFMKSKHSLPCSWVLLHLKLWRN